MDATIPRELRDGLFLSLPVITVAVSSGLLLLVRRPPPFTPARLLGGYMGALVAALVLAGVLSYVPPETAQRELGIVPADFARRWWHEFKLAAGAAVWVTLMGFAVVGAPVVFAMSRLGYGSVVRVLAASAVLALPLVVLLASMAGEMPLPAAAGLVGGQLFLACGFTLGLGLPLLRPRPALRSLPS